MVYPNTAVPQVKKDLYPPIEPYDTGRLKVSDLHELYYEQVGNPEVSHRVIHTFNLNVHLFIHSFID